MYDDTNMSSPKTEKLTEQVLTSKENVTQLSFPENIQYSSFVVFCDRLNTKKMALKVSLRVSTVSCQKRLR